MKTNQIMVRKMGNFDVNQRTKDGMFNATALLKQWNQSAVSEKVKEKRTIKFLELDKTKEFIETIIENENTQLPDNQESNLKHKPGNQVVSKTRAKTLKNGKRISGEYWMHPLLFIDFAMWLNARFKYKVLKFVQDELIESRHNAGDSFKAMNTAVKTLKGENKVFYKDIARALNFITFGNHISGGEMRQNATQNELKELAALENMVANVIESDLINTQDELLSFLRKQYVKKFPKNPFLKR